MSYLFIVVGPNKVKTNAGHEGFTSSSNPMIGRMYGNMLDEVETSKQGIVETVAERHRIKAAHDTEIRSVRVNEMPAQNKEAYAALAREMAVKENIEDQPYQWDALVWDTPMFSFPALVIWVTQQTSYAKPREQSVLQTSAASRRDHTLPRKRWWQLWR